MKSNVKKIVDNLLVQKIVSNEEATELNSELENQSIDTLRVLSRFFYKKTSGTAYPSGPVMFIYRVKGIKKDKVEPDLLNRLLDVIFSNNLIEDITHQKLKNEISDFQIADSFHLIYRLTNLNHFYLNFTKEHQLEFFKQLKGEDFQSNLIDHRKEKKLSSAIEKGKLNSYLDFFRYCYNCRFLDFNPKKYNRNDLFKRLLKIFGELSYKSFIIDNCYFEITENDEIKAPAYKLINLSFQIAGKIFSYSYELRDDLASKKYNYGYDIENFLELLNSTLTAFGFDYRFAVIDDRSESKGALQEDYQFAICMIDKQMQHLFDSSKLRDRFLFIRQHLNFWPLLSYYQIQYSLYYYKSSGILSHLNNEQVENISATIYDKTYGNYVNLISCFPDTVTTISRWKRLGKQPYRFFLESLSKISHGVLNFYDIEDGYPDLPIEKEIDFEVSFKIDGERYNLKMTSYGEFNTQIVHEVNEIVKKNYSDYLLFDVIGSGVENYYYMFLTMEQAEYLYKYNILETHPIF
ncbi:MAG TPA: hypothetical protein VK671_06585 [Mucilaginibacter sp.]|nr:hypothetical protein [Mucilaginibacter sp.]